MTCFLRALPIMLRRPSVSLACVVWLLLTSLPESMNHSHLGYLAESYYSPVWSAPAVAVCLLFLRHTKQAPATGPLHLLFPLLWYPMAHTLISPGSQLDVP